MQVQVNHQAMGICGYTVPWCATAGDIVSLHLSSVKQPDKIRLLRLDEPVERELELPVILTNDTICAHKTFQQGSFLRVVQSERLKSGLIRSLRFELMLTKNDQRRVVFQVDGFTAWWENGGIVLEQQDTELLRLADIPERKWLIVDFRISDGVVSLRIKSHDPLAPIDLLKEARLFQPDYRITTLLLGSDAACEKPCLNARFARIAMETVRGKFEWTFPTLLPEAPLLASYEGLSIELESVGLPTFCVTSARWDGSTFDPRVKPNHYDAIHCHDDDMAPLEWPASCHVNLPEDLRSGVYAFRVECGNEKEDIVFFVRQKTPTSKLVFVVPTATYLAYADEFLPSHLYEWQCDDRGHRLAQDNRFRSLYDYHSDLSGVSICSYRKPKATLRLDYLYPLGNCPHNLPVDLEFLRFCRRNNVEIDIITDHDLHSGGLDMFSSYNAVLTGSHPEYMSVEMEGAFRAFAAQGGSIVYLGGNGFATTVAFRDDLMELRRSPLEAGRTWDGAISELSFALTNEPGGYLRGRGKGEFGLTGVAISLMGFEEGRPFTRAEESYEPQNTWLFEGVTNETFGDTGRVLGAAAGYEVDATDYRLGTSPDTIIVARADGFSANFYHDPSRWYEGGDPEMHSRRCAEMTLRYLKSGGLIFCASSVAWLGSLPETDSMNDVGRITLNVLHRLQNITNLQTEKGMTC